MNNHASESGHFYYPDGRPCYTIVGKNGKERNTTKKDAKKLGLYPGVTTITGEAHSDGLLYYKVNQAIEAALTLPRHEGENSADYIKRVRHDAKEHARIRAEEGTAIHAYLQQLFEGKLLDWTYPSVAMETIHECYKAAAAEIIEKIGVQEWECEKSFGREVYLNFRSIGFGGKVDLHNDTYLLDIKSKEGSLGDVKLYDNHLAQLAAYRVGLYLNNVNCLNNVRCGILFVSTNMTAKLVMADGKDINRGWRMFRALLGYWYSKYKFEGVGQKEVTK